MIPFYRSERRDYFRCFNVLSGNLPFHGVLRCCQSNEDRDLCLRKIWGKRIRLHILANNNPYYDFNGMLVYHILCHASLLTDLGVRGFHGLN